MMPADHAAWITARAAVWAAVLTGLSAAGVLWGAWIARTAARTWRGVHEHAKADECIAAAYNCSHVVNRVVNKRWELDSASAVHNTTLSFPAEAYDEAWAAWRRFQLAHVIARRYHPGLDSAVPSRIATALGKLEAWCLTPYENVGLSRVAANVEADDIKQNVLAVAEQITAALVPVEMTSKATTLKRIGRAIRRRL